MSTKTMRILHVEDAETEVGNINASVNRHNLGNSQLKIEVVSAKSLEEAKSKIDESLDGAIIDLKLNNDDSAGECYFEFLKANFVRIPCVVLTGTPDNITHEHDNLKIFTKGEADSSYVKIFKYFEEIYNTGLTEIMGTRGLIEESLYKVFSEAIIPHKSSWIENAKINNVSTQASLLRYTINHLYSILENNKHQLLPEEFYLKTFAEKNINTGSIFKQDDINYIVITPACDLAQCKTQHIQVLEVETHNNVYEKEATTKKDGTAYNEKDQKSHKQKLRKNAKGDCYHYLPETAIFCGGFINFRKIKFLDFNPETLSITSDVQVSPYFMKDIISRFSSYYARQGQPDFLDLHRDN
jgi:uncharacterized membrane protein YkoI